MAVTVARRTARLSNCCTSKQWWASAK